MNEQQPTEAELMVLRCFSHGLDIVSAAEILGTSRDAVRERLKSVRPKLRAKTTTQAVAHALRQQLIR